MKLVYNVNSLLALSLTLFGCGLLAPAQGSPLIRFGPVVRPLHLPLRGGQFVGVPEPAVVVGGGARAPLVKSFREDVAGGKGVLESGGHTQFN
ncbi:hypothetical protein CVT26_005603 [Gymnopilus dilepis]|uniref:Secreted protein n=1 Tax=Gymnopilus dilepis TaxID=231916 RepID=A0A409XZT6_9AGAR|nr:hypothetical protein CVT26_005603 [Gymnopilus dilepis]